MPTHEAARQRAQQLEALVSQSEALVPEMLELVERLGQYTDELVAQMEGGHDGKTA